MLLSWESEGASISEKKKKKETSGVKLNGEDARQSCYKICAGDILPARPVHPSVETGRTKMHSLAGTLSSPVFPYQKLRQ